MRAQVIEISTLCARSTIRPFHDALRFHDALLLIEYMS
jgi:hypothetical protein